VIHHIAQSELWDAAQAGGSYAAASLAIEGFIHLSSPTQWEATLERYYPDRTGLVLLDVDDTQREVVAALKWEVSTGGELFPHLYARLPVAAVVGVRSLQP
jgi:uncharacterized protein (DUF952 family)